MNKPIGTTPNITRVAFVEDDPGLQSSLKRLLTSAEELELVGCSGSGESAIEQMPAWKPEVIIMDINLPGMNGVECVRRLKPLLPSTQFLMLTVYEDSELLFNSLMAGATGYLLKRTSNTKLIEAIRDIHKGGSPMTPAIARRVVLFLTQIGGAKPARLNQLTRRENECLELLAKGFAYKQVADNLGMSLGTVRTHIRGIYEKLQVHSRTDAVMKFMKYRP
jgi:DNA-binding NarL/FixJ family response regulator